MAERSIIVAGSVAQRPGRGGHTWVFLQYLLGFRRLGFDVLLLDRLEPEMVIDGRRSVEDSPNVRYLQEVMRRFDLADKYSLSYDGGSKWVGLPGDEVLERVRESHLLLNFNGFISDEQILEAAPLPVYLDIDPGFGQMWHELGLHDPFPGHDAYVTVGESIGQPGCDLPTCGLDWITTPQPVVLDLWPPTGGGELFTTIASWRGPFAPIEYGAATYGLRVHEWRELAPLPSLSDQSFEVALDIDPSDEADVELLRSNSWSLVDPLLVAGDPWAYQRYVQGSKAELMVAKNIYVRSASGWFSDRSICYLASGKPVLAQDTGFTRHHPTGEGLVAFTTLDEALAGVEAIASDYERHAQAARALAVERFESSVVLRRLLDSLGLD
jgi:hypothetical protein